MQTITTSEQVSLTVTHLNQRSMEKPTIFTRSCPNHKLLFLSLISFLLCSLLIFLDYSATFHGPKHWLSNTATNPCKDRYIYIHELPPRFNRHILENCHSLTRGTDKPNMCPYMVNLGLGPEITNSCYETNQFMLEIIFHNRMRKYNCLTNDSSLASAIFVPFYAGLDVSRFLWVSNLTERDSSGQELLQWLVNKPEWKKMWGRDHFLVSGRISWDLRRQFDDESYWGSKFRFFPESMNMSMLAVEASSWNNDYAIPYPTSFHPRNESEVFQWQSKILHRKRPYLFSFTGAPRPELENSIRGKIIDQCRGSNACRFIDCSYGKEKCDDPINVMKVFEKSVFCLQPPGDSYTRRSIFDSMLAGCVPVFFHPGTAYSQYLWYFPKNRTKYSVYIPVKDVKEWNVSVDKVLLGISEDEVVAMREEVIKLIPRIIYADPRSNLDNLEDAFDVAVKGILERIEIVRELIRNGRDPSVGFADEDHYKYTFSDNYS
ncbi:probable xyloglucan galactosyltransferase GT14 [Lotus japonicus]|uniref:probable xyloglucan galactosyltransferase GT14 n=1 Tax=Lotus japonicus TaxID=34305 RepID=UPI002582A4FA|nr:probable xyloglucan galactosyltransferase GT14 [Lotus japonicus]